jgi:sterol desaturase/sphingolipid hydroxylase (fatty acid hydroxylase superfamily)
MNIFSNIGLFFTTFVVWTSIISLPLILTYNDLYLSISPKEYYTISTMNLSENSHIDKELFSYERHSSENTKKFPSSLGLILGISTVMIGHFFSLLYFYIFKNIYNPISIQKIGAPKYVFKNALINHLYQYEGFIIISFYLIITWMLKILPLSYYSFNGGIIWIDVISLLLLQDFIQYLIHILEHRLDHILEHKLNIELYKISHKPHHRFTNPKLFDAFNGSIFDTFLMIIVPFLLTTQIIKTNVWSYMTFGSLYANWLTFLHSEYSHPWDKILFKYIGFGTPADHHVHHKLFVYNYGHLFIYWDKFFGTYKNPSTVFLHE